jgi:hypothetical protein
LTLALLATGLSTQAQAATQIDENLIVEVQLQGSAATQSAPLDETVVGDLTARFPAFSTANSVMPSLRATLLVNGVATGQRFTTSGSPTVGIGRGFGNGFRIDVTESGQYAAKVTGDYTFYEPSTSSFETRSVDAVIPLFSTASGRDPRQTKVKRIKGPKELAFTMDGYRKYRYKVFVLDRDHVLDEAQIDGVSVPQSRWKRTNTGWVIPYVKEVEPASPYEFRRLPKVYRYTIRAYLSDRDLESWQVRRADTARGTYKVKFRKK